MKFIHTSDLHIGKRVNEFPMFKDQQYILNKILELVERENPQLFIIAGDIYDKSTPPAEAVALFDSFITSLAKMGIPTAAISGNHDSAERIAFGSALMRENSVFFSPVYSGKLMNFNIKDEWGSVKIHLMPFLRPSSVRAFFEQEIISHNAAVEAVLNTINMGERNILIAHQFVTGAVMSESEDITVGGLDNIDRHLFEKFDYVALGHIHRSQSVGDERIRYSGTPLKYSFSEALHTKSVTIVELNKKGDLEIRAEELEPLRDLREIKGMFSKLTDITIVKKTDDYMHITLTDEEEILDAVGKLRVLYPNIMKLDYDNSRTRAQSLNVKSIENKEPYELFSDFYMQQNGTKLSPEQCKYTKALICKLREG